MSSRSNTPVQDQRGDRYQADTGQSGGNAGFEEDPLVELARIVSEGNARYRPVALGTEGDAPAAPQGSYDASRDLVDHEAWARELEAGLSNDFGTYAPEAYAAPEAAGYQGQDYQDQDYDDPAGAYPQDDAEAFADDSYPQDRREAEVLAPQPYVDEVYADRALVDEGLAYSDDPHAQPYEEGAYADEAYAEGGYAEPDVAEEPQLDAYARRAAEARTAPAYAPAQLWAGSATQADDAGYYDEEAAEAFADDLAAEEETGQAAAPADDPLASLEDELLGALRGPRAAEPAWGASATAEAAQDDYADDGYAEDPYRDDDYEQNGYGSRQDEDDDLLGLDAAPVARHYGTAPAAGVAAAGAASGRYRDEYDEAVDDIFAGEGEAPPPPGGYDLDEVAQAMREGDPQLGGHGVLPPHSEREQEAAEPAAKSKRGLYVAAAVLGVVVLGGGVFALTNLGGDEMSGPPPVITADGEDLKVYPDSQTAANDGQNKLIYDRVGSDGDERLVLQDETPVASLPPAPLSGNEDADGASGVSSGPRKVRTVVVRPDGTIISGDAPGRTAPGTATAPATTLAGDTARVPGTSPEEPAGATAQPTTDANGVRQVSTTPITSGAGEGAPTQLTSTLDAAGQAANGAANQLSGGQDAQNPVAAGTDPTAANVPRTKPGDIDTLAANATPAAPRQSEPVRNTQAPLDLTAQAPRVPTAPAQTQQPAATQASAPATGAIPAGTYIVQVSSQRTQDQAQAAFGDLQRRYGSVLGGVTPVIERADLGDRGTFYRVRIPTSSRDDAISLCERLKSAGGDCFVRRN